MRILVLVKEVPDTWGDRKLNLETGLADRAASDSVIDEIGERSLEVALSYADAHAGTEVIVMMMAPESASGSVRKALAMGAASAIHIVDDALLGADLGLTAQTLAAAISRSDVDLVITGNQSTDGSGGVMAAMLGELMDVPAITSMNSVQISDSEVSGERSIDGGSMTVSAELPAVISITERLPDARFPNFKGIMAAKKKPVETLSLSDLGVVADDPRVARSIMTAIAEKPPRAAGVKIVDEGDAGAKLAEYLLENRLA